MLVEDSIEAAGFVRVALDAILDVLWGIAREVVGLSLHRSYASIEEEELR